MPEESTNVAMTVLAESRAITVGDRHISAVDLATLGLEWSQEFTTRNDESCVWVSASVTLDTVYCGDLFGHIIERSLSTGAPTDRSFDPQLGAVGPLAVLDDGRELVAVDRGRAITRWRLDGSGAVARVLAPGWSVVDRYSPTGSSIVVARRTDDVESWEDYREFAVLDTRTEELIVRLPVPSFGVKWAGADTLVGDFGGVGPSRTGFLDVRTGESLAGDPLPEESIGAWMNEPGDRAYIARDGGEIWTFDPRTGRRVEPTLQTNGGEPTFLSTSPDGSRVLVTSWNSRYIPDSMVFDAETGAHGEVGLLRIGRTALSAGGEIIGASREEVVRYDGETLERIGALPGISGGIETVNASPDGRTYSVFSLDEAVSVYDLVAGIRLGDPIAVSSEGAISGVFRADGAELAVNVPAGIAVWDLRPSAHSAAACAMAGRDLTREEWASYLAELGPYRSTCGFGED
jgi:hypothetical protein